MIPAAHLAIEVVRRHPARAGPATAYIATLEEETLSLPVQQQAADQTLLVRQVGKKLGGTYMQAQQYNHIYGTVCQQYPWGHKIWKGLQMEIKNGMQHPWKGGPQDYIGNRAMGGYFLCPHPFSNENARQPYATSAAHDPLTYPAVFVEISEDVYVMWCLAIVTQRSRGWWVHKSRACVWPENNFFDDLLKTPAGRPESM
jgi:hypothetical protein